MKRLAPFVLVLFVTAGCHPPVTIVTPQGKVAFTANEILKRVQELQEVVIAVDATPNNGLPRSATRLIVQFTVEAAKILDATPSGWGTTVAIAWADAKKQIPLKYLMDPRLQAAVLGVDVALAIFLPPGGGA